MLLFLFIILFESANLFKVWLDPKEGKRSRLKTFTLQIEPMLKSLNLREFDISSIIPNFSRASNNKLFLVAFAFNLFNAKSLRSVFTKWWSTLFWCHFFIWIKGRDLEWKWDSLFHFVTFVITTTGKMPAIDVVVLVLFWFINEPFLSIKVGEMLFEIFFQQMEEFCTSCFPKPDFPENFMEIA